MRERETGFAGTHFAIKRGTSTKLLFTQPVVAACTCSPCSPPHPPSHASPCSAALALRPKDALLPIPHSPSFQKSGRRVSSTTLEHTTLATITHSSLGLGADLFGLCLVSLSIKHIVSLSIKHLVSLSIKHIVHLPNHTPANSSTAASNLAQSKQLHALHSHHAMRTWLSGVKFKRQRKISTTYLDKARWRRGKGVRGGLIQGVRGGLIPYQDATRDAQRPRRLSGCKNVAAVGRDTAPAICICISVVRTSLSSPLFAALCLSCLSLTLLAFLASQLPTHGTGEARQRARERFLYSIFRVPWHPTVQIACNTPAQ